MQVILFIGHHKVGSSSLQHFLSQNAIRLLRHGILYPATESEGLTWAMRDALTPRRRRADPLPINAREPHNALAFRMLSEVTKFTVPQYHKGIPGSKQMLRAIAQQVSVFKPKQVILCAEAFSQFGFLAPDLIGVLKEAFAGDEFRILCTLRRPDEHLPSWHAQRMQFGQTMAPLRGKALPYYMKNFHFDTRLMLDPWVQAFADSPIIVRNYRDVLAAGGAVQDFKAQSGVKFPARLFKTHNMNPSIPYALMEIARRANRDLDRPQADHLRAFLRGYASHADLPPNAEVEMFGPENRARMTEAFAPIHDYLGQFAKGGVFFPDAPDMARLRPRPELEVMREVLPALCREAARLFGDTAITGFLQDQLRAE